MSKHITQLHNVDPEDFKREILSGVAKQLQKFSENFKPKEPTIWIGRKEAAEILGVTFPLYSIGTRKVFFTPLKLATVFGIVEMILNKYFLNPIKKLQNRSFEALHLLFKTVKNLIFEICQI